MPVILDKSIDCTQPRVSVKHLVESETQFTMVGDATVTISFNDVIVGTLNQSNPTYITSSIGEHTVSTNSPCKHVTVSANETLKQVEVIQSVENCNGDDAVLVNDPCSLEVLNEIRSSLESQTTELLKQLQLIESSIKNVVTTLDDGIVVTPDETGVWTIDNPNQVSAQEIADAILTTGVTISGQDAELIVEISNDKLMVEVVNLPTIPFDVEQSQVCLTILDGDAPETYNGYQGYGGPYYLLSFKPEGVESLDLSATVNTYVRALVNGNGSFVTLDNPVKIIENGELLLSPQQWFDTWYDLMSQHHDIEPKSSFNVSNDYVIFSDVTQQLSNRYVVITTIELNDGRTLNAYNTFNRFVSNITSVGNEKLVDVQVTKHTVYTETGDIGRVYYTNERNVVVDGDEVLCDPNGTGVTYGQEFNDTQTVTDKRNIVVTVRNGQVMVMRNDGEPVLYGKTDSDTSIYRTEPIDGDVTVTPVADTNANYIIEYREV